MTEFVQLMLIIIPQFEVKTLVSQATKFISTCFAASLLLPSTVYAWVYKGSLVSIGNIKAHACSLHDQAAASCSGTTGLQGPGPAREASSQVSHDCYHLESLVPSYAQLLLGRDCRPMPAT